jgi:hypothetical protein
LSSGFIRHVKYEAHIFPTVRQMFAIKTERQFLLVFGNYMEVNWKVLNQSVNKVSFFSKGPNGVGVFPTSSRDGNRSNFQNVFLLLE